MVLLKGLLTWLVNIFKKKIFIEGSLRNILISSYIENPYRAVNRTVCGVGKSPMNVPILSGSVDELKIFDKALTAEEVNSLWIL